MKTPFKLKSGNSTSFKQMGSSPVRGIEDARKGGIFGIVRGDVVDKISDKQAQLHKKQVVNAVQQGDTNPSLFQKQTVTSEQNLSKADQRKYNVQISKARAQYRKDMPTVYKDKPRKREKFVEDYMSKFTPPEYTVPTTKVKESPKQNTTTFKAPQGTELTQYFHGAKSANVGTGSGWGERGDEPGLSEDRQTEIGNWIKHGGKYSGKGGEQINLEDITIINK